MANSDSRVVSIELSRNFGHQAAISAGLEVFDADALIMMDGDGEQPPSLVPEMIGLYEMGYDIVQAQRIDTEHKGSAFKRVTGSLFYALINRLGQTHVISGGADFRLMSREAGEALRQLPEYHRFYRGMVQWIGFRSVVLPYTRRAGSDCYICIVSAPGHELALA